jgi:cytoskeletal protein RodZ
MDSQFLIVVISVLVIIAIAAAVWIYAKKTKSERLQRKFGPEYDQTVERLRNREVAEAELQQREKRVERFRIVPLSMKDSSAYQESWTGVQSRFVDDPSGAVEEANQLVSEVMKKRGYPVTDFEQGAADLSVDHSAVVTNYRAASRIAERNRRGGAGTEELRQAFVHYRVLFDDLLESRESHPKTARPFLREDRNANRTQSRKINRGGLDR